LRITSRLSLAGVALDWALLVASDMVGSAEQGQVGRGPVAHTWNE
jgi:hypothetical protein